MDSRLLTTPCTIVTISAGTADVYGDATEGTATTSTVCHYRQLKADELQGAAVEQTQWRVYLPAATTLSGADRVIIAGNTYTLSGDPYPVIRPTTGLVDHVEATVERTR